MNDTEYQKLRDEIQRKLCGEGGVVVFGCGPVAEMFAHVLLDLKSTVAYYVVNDGHRKQASFFQKEVFEISEINDTSQIKAVFYGIGEKNDKIAEKVLEKYGEKLIYLDYKIALCILLEQFYRDYFFKHHIDVTKKEIKIGDCRLVNPFEQEFSFRLELLTPLRDIVLPMMLNDYENMNEGTYECGDVTIEEGKILFDCGANVGVFSAVAAAKGAKVYAFEPIDQVIEQLKETQRLYPEQIRIIPYALSDQIGTEEFYIEEEYGAVCTMCDSLSGKNSKAVRIQTTTIDDFVEENQIGNVDFIKADIEGAERHMLRGAAKTLRTMQPKLAIATYHLEDDVRVLEEIILDINPNYVITHKWKMLYAYVPSADNG